MTSNTFFGAKSNVKSGTFYLFHDKESMSAIVYERDETVGKPTKYVATSKKWVWDIIYIYIYPPKTYFKP